MQDREIPLEWQALLKEFRRRLDLGRGMGGPKKLAQRGARLNAREVIAGFVDTDSFLELGSLVGGFTYQQETTAPCDGIVGGLAMLDGRPIVLAVEDFTVMGGSIGHGAASKRLRFARLAAQERIPYILFLDGAGYRSGNALERHPYAPNDLQELAKLSGVTPTVAVVLGTSAGHGALSGVMMDFVVMLKDACLFSAGPPLVATATGESLSKEQLGGATMHASRSGVCHNLVENEAEAFALVRRYLNFLPSSAWQSSPRLKGAPCRPRHLPEILHLVPRDGQQPYDMQGVIDLLIDQVDESLVMQPLFGTSIITTLARLGGFAVGILANQPNVAAGAIDAAAALKATHFLDICNAYHLPVIFLADNPGILPGSQAEAAGTLRAAARMYAAQAALRGTKIHVTLRKAFGFGSSVMGMNPFDGQTLSLAFPGATLGGIPALGGGQAAGADATTQAQLQAAQQHASWSAADTMAYDEIIDPRDLRSILIRGLEQAAAHQHRAPGPASNAAIRP